jgi:hypothetical protein
MLITVTDEEVPAQSGFGWHLGRFALFCRDRWVLAITVLLGGIALAVLPRTAVDDKGRMFTWALVAVIVLTVAAAAAVFLDRLADWHAKRADRVVTAAHELAGVASLGGVLALLGELRDVGMAPSRDRSARFDAIPTAAAAAAVSAASAPNVRATYYQVRHDDAGWRQLVAPKSWGRTDEAGVEYDEKTDPAMPLWAILSGRDSECAIVSEPDESEEGESSGIVWRDQPYKTVISVPVKVGDTAHGLLSLNAPNRGDLTEVDRLTAITMARSIAATIAATSVTHGRPGSDRKRHLTWWRRGDRSGS